MGVLAPVADAANQIAAREAQLVAEIAAGNIQEPVRELYRLHARRLYRFGLQVLSHPGLAEEMVQESFVRL
jgi:DNA-directed RNA polymerase specialized sigma24 family protein